MRPIQQLFQAYNQTSAIYLSTRLSPFTSGRHQNCLMWKNDGLKILRDATLGPARIARAPYVEFLPRFEHASREGIQCQSFGVRPTREPRAKSPKIAPKSLSCYALATDLHDACSNSKLKGFNIGFWRSFRNMLSNQSLCALIKDSGWSS